MIVKIKTHKKPNFKKLFNYLLNDKGRLFDEEKNSFLITHNLHGDTPEEWTEQFKENEIYRENRRKDAVLLYHEILSWHRDDAKNLSLEKMEDMAQEYIQLRNPNGLFVAVPHHDKEHLHVHFAVSALEYHSGKTMRQSKKEFAELKKNIQQYQKEKYPELSKSVVQHGRGNAKALSDNEWQMKNRTERASEKEILAEKINECLSKAKSPDDFLKLLKENNMRPYERGVKVAGVWWRNKKYRFGRLMINKEILSSLQKNQNRKKELLEIRKGNTKKELGR